MSLLALALTSAAPAAEVVANDEVELVLGGDLKSFFVATLPGDNPILPEDPSGVGIAHLRARFDLRIGQVLKVQVHHAITGTAGGTPALGTLSTGLSTVVPEVVTLSWRADTGADLGLQGRTDRLLIAAHLPHLDVTLGRQPISFGSGLIFTPLDLVAPFSPGVVDQEYKPGVDALRADLGLGMATRITAVAAYSGSLDRAGSIYAAFGQTTIGLVDVGVFLGEVHADHVVGLSVVGSAGAVGLHGDVALTVPDGQTPFVRGVLGADWRPFATTTLALELYGQSIGASDPADYLLFATSDRVGRGELWTLGHAYVGAAWSQEILPILTSNLAVVANLEDPSALVVPGLSWSVAGDAVLVVGANLALGRRPEPTGADVSESDSLAEITRSLGTRSEFGTYPHSVYLQFKTYF